jgi:hypothetical protein
MRSRSSPTVSELRSGRYVSSGYVGGRLMWWINLSIAIAAWIAVCAAVIKLVEAMP